MPVFRARQEELKVLKSFNFDERIYPCIEIVKEFDRERKKQKKFEEIYLDIIHKVKALKVFVDLPIHLKQSRSMNKDVLTFLRSVVGVRKNRTEYMLKLAKCADKVIPVISSYFSITSEPNTIRSQAADLRSSFSSLAFRTFPDTIKNDMVQIKSVVQKNDFLIVDVNEQKLDVDNIILSDVIEQLEDFNKCTVIVLKTPIGDSLTNVSLLHGELVETILNDQVDKYSQFNAEGFGDYAGIKKGSIKEGGSISPGFLYYDATENSFYGYKGNKPELAEFEKTIVPDVISSGATSRMRLAKKNFLSNYNSGWTSLKNIKSGVESGKSQAKFKGIAMGHYLHCIKKRITLGELD